MKSFYILLACLLAPLFAFAQSVSPSPVPVPATDILVAVLKFLQSIKGASPLLIIAGVIQIVMLVVNSTLGDIAGKWKILLVSLLSLIGAVVSGLMGGEGWLQILGDASVLAAGQVFLHQLVTQISEPNVA